MLVKVKDPVWMSAPGLVMWFSLSVMKSVENGEIFSGRA
jgi:hypothetical protein